MLGPPYPKAMGQTTLPRVDGWGGPAPCAVRAEPAWSPGEGNHYDATDKVENALVKEYFTTTGLEAVLDP